MTTTARGRFEITSWNEAPYKEMDDGRKLSKASVTQRFTGDIEGDGAVEWLMYYRPDKTATFVGLQLVTGTLAGRSGSFVLETRGGYDGTTASWTWSVVPGSGTGDLQGLRGSGDAAAGHGSVADFTLDYELA